MKDSPAPAAIPFRKMHGLGNDFVIIDARRIDDPVTPARARAIGDRHRGIGFDQLAVIRPGISPGIRPGIPTDADADADAAIDFWNADGTLAGACGNATRCVARLLFAETGKDRLRLRTARGILIAEAVPGGLIRVNMGQPQLDWQDIPLAAPADTACLPLPGSPGAAGMGNPHLVVFVPDAAAVDPAAEGPGWEHHPLFPQRTNVEFVQVIDEETVRARVWERGTGVTLACGSGACAIAVAAHRRGLTGRSVTVRLDGGPLMIDWRDDGVWMTGPAALVAEGTLSPEFLDGAAEAAP
jgi:diaminopimelate epimerase